MLQDFDSGIVFTAASVLLLLPAVLYIVGPVVIRYRHTMKSVGTLHPVMAEQVPADVAAFIGGTVHEVAPLGFRPVLNVREEDLTPGVYEYTLLFVNQGTGDTAMALFTISSFAHFQQRLPTITLSTKFADGTSVVTTTFGDSLFPRDPRVRGLSLPKLRNTPLLVEIHRRRRARVAPGVAAVLPPPGEELRALIEEHAQALARIASAGYLAFDARRQRYRLTWKGAYLMTWKLLPPVRQLIRARRRAGARTELRELGIDPAVADGAGN